MVQEIMCVLDSTIVGLEIINSSDMNHFITRSINDSNFDVIYNG